MDIYSLTFTILRLAASVMKNVMSGLLGGVSEGGGPSSPPYYPLHATIILRPLPLVTEAAKEPGVRCLEQCVCLPPLQGARMAWGVEHFPLFLFLQGALY